jgi:hypothetical protein
VASFNGRALGDDALDVMLTLPANTPIVMDFTPDRGRIRKRMTLCRTSWVVALVAVGLCLSAASQEIRRPTTETLNTSAGSGKPCNNGRRESVLACSGRPRRPHMLKRNDAFCSRCYG